MFKYPQVSQKKKSLPIVDFLVTVSGWYVSESLKQTSATYFIFFPLLVSHTLDFADLSFPCQTLPV